MKALSNTTKTEGYNTKPVIEKRELLRGVVEKFDTARLNGIIRFGEDRYNINRLNIAQDAAMLPENETVTFELKQTEQGVILHKVRTAIKRKRGKIVVLGTEWGKIKGNDQKYYSFFFDEILVQYRKLSIGDAVEFALTGSEDGAVAYRVMVDNDYALNKFCGGIRSKNYELLAALAKPENWNYLNLQHTLSNPLLENYFQHTFENAMQQNLIGYEFNETDHTAHAYFNTGLRTGEGETIYATFYKKTKLENFSKNVNWKFNKFIVKDLSFLISCDRIPVAPCYYSSLDQITLSKDVKMLISDRYITAKYAHLLPAFFLSGDTEFARQKVNLALCDSLKRFSKGIVKAVPIVTKELATEFVLPVYLQGKVALAMTLKRSNDNMMLVQSILPLDFAYKYARIIQPVTEEWLKPICFFEKVDWL